MCTTKGMTRINKTTKKLIAKYEINKSKKVGDECKCVVCGNTFIKKQYAQIFCGSKQNTRCKDYFWNNVDRTKYCNTTRISPQNARYYNNVILPEIATEYGFPDVETMRNHVDDFDGSWDAHGCIVENCEYCNMRPQYCQCEKF